MGYGLHALVVASALLWWGCGRIGDKPEFYNDKDPVLNFTQNSARRQSVDILWIVDDSGSMREEQQALADNFEGFIHDFLELKINFQMAIVTTDAVNANNRDTENRLNSQSAARNVQGFVRYFGEKINVGIAGSGNEQGLVQSTNFFSQNPSWLRTGAYLVVIYVSDEQDCSPGSVENYVDELKGLKDGIDRVKLFAIAQSGGECTIHPANGKSRYVDAAERTGGSSSNITGSFNDILNDFGREIVNLTRTFALPEQLDVSKLDTVEIRVNGGEPLPRNVWEYLGVSNSIRFKEGHVPGPGARISIVYTDER